MFQWVQCGWVYARQWCSDICSSNGVVSWLFVVYGRPIESRSKSIKQSDEASNLRRLGKCMISVSWDVPVYCFYYYIFYLWCIQWLCYAIINYVLWNEKSLFKQDSLFIKGETPTMSVFSYSCLHHRGMNPHFIDFCKDMDPMFHLPSHSHMSQQLLPNAVSCKVLAVQNKLESTHNWHMDRSRCHLFLAATAHNPKGTTVKEHMANRTCSICKLYFPSNATAMQHKTQLHPSVKRNETPRIRPARTAAQRQR